ncbi:MAG TPA: DUF5686 family protein [Cyclobacteriaceae bacterium]|nr:DUF5686 family protein [Cyclobacteriaceae bacterium]
MNQPSQSKLIILLSIAGLLFLAQTAKAQETSVKGRVMDASSGDPIPFANLLFKGTSVGVTTDFEGNFSLKTNLPVDSLIASYVGYKSRTKFVKRGTAQVVNFQLEEETTRLKEVVITAGENPAFAILRKVDDYKKEHDKRRLSAYECEAYTKIEIAIDNMTDKFRERKVMQKITQVLDSIERIAGEDGKPILPMFISENVSKLYYRTDPQLKTETILHSKINGLGIEDGYMSTQLIGASFQEYNFYQNWLHIVGKDFISPIADGGRLFYEYDLTDSVFIDNFYCYRIDFTPKSPQDLAFTGSMWITKNEYALKQIDVSIGKQANLNFIEKIKIQQELEPTGEGAWFPMKNRVLLDVSELSNNTAGLLAKFYSSNKDIITNQPHEPSFYARAIVTDEKAYDNKEENYWDSLRHEPLSATEKNVNRMIDTLRNIPVVKTYTDIVMIIVDGYYEVGKVDVGPYISTMAINNIEGFRLQAGFLTNSGFSKKWVLGSQFGYGFKDEKFKYSVNVQRILSKERWSTVSIGHRSDIARVGVDDEALADNYVFLALQRFGNYRRGYYFDESRFSIQREFVKGFTQRAAFRYKTFDPTFAFGYKNPEDPTQVLGSFQTAEAIFESRFARDEIFLQNETERLSLGTTKWPVIILRYTHGFQGFNGSDFSYNKLYFSINKHFKYGVIGNADVDFAAENIFDALPYPLLGTHLGNQTPIYSPVLFNLMNFGEFVSDRYVSMMYRHNFEGLLLNRIPLMRKLKWRLVGGANILFGSLSQKNKDLLASQTPTGADALEIGYLNWNKPYVEVSYGVENIFKFFRVDFAHRLTYLDYNPDVKTRKFGVLVGIQISL